MAPINSIFYLWRGLGMSGNWTKESMPDLTGKVVIITGASSGLGLATATAMAQKNATVIVAVRNLQKGQAALNHIKTVYPMANVKLMRLDLTDLALIRSFADQFLHEYQTLSILINNAGIMNTPFRLTSDGFESQFGCNHLGHFALTGLLLPRLLNTPSSRVVTVSSLVAHKASIHFDNLDGSKGYSGWKFYGQSKLANMMFARELNNKLAEHQLDTMSIACHPGFSNTNLMSFGSGKRANPLLRMISNLASQSADMGALPSLYSATALNISGGEYVGPDGRSGRKGYPKLDPIIDKLYQSDISQKLWEVSEQLTGVKYKFDK